MLSNQQQTNGEDPNNNKLEPPSENDFGERMKQIDDLKLFLATANDGWDDVGSPATNDHYRMIRTYPLPTGESVSCVLWNNLYHITGTDIVRSLIFRFHAFGRPVHNLKKFEEGIFSDLRNLKPGQDACLEEPRSEFLDILYKNNCIRTKKKQKVFYWFSVPHDRLFLDALERDLKREKLGIESTSTAIAEPALSLSLDTTQELFDHLRKTISLLPYSDDTSPTTNPISLEEISAPPTKNKVWIGQSSFGNDEAPIQSQDTSSLGQDPIIMQHQPYHEQPFFSHHSPHHHQNSNTISCPSSPKQLPVTLIDHSFLPTYDHQIKKKIFGNLTLFDGSPTYKQRRHRASSMTSHCTSSNITSFEKKKKHHSVPSIHSLHNNDFKMENQTSKFMQAAIEASLQHQNQHHYEEIDSNGGSFTYNEVEQQQHDGNDGDDYDEEEEEGSNDSDHNMDKPMISTSSYNSLAKATSTLATFITENHKKQGNQGSPTFTCPLHACGKLFRRLEHLKRHLRTHTLHRPHLCQICGKRFSRSDNLNQHKKIHQKNSNSHHHLYQQQENQKKQLMITTTNSSTTNSAASSSASSPIIQSFSGVPFHNEMNKMDSPLVDTFGGYSATSSILPSPSSSTSSPYIASLPTSGTSSNPNNMLNDYYFSNNNSTSNYHFQISALQQALTSCSVNPSQQAWITPPPSIHGTPSTSTSLLTSSFVPTTNFFIDDQDWAYQLPQHTFNLN
ncbi:unnamed protein product [Cunninghamella echinulata]